MGLFCKGLHCAGCGKGIPLSIVVVLILIASRAGTAISGTIEECIIAIMASIAFGVIATPLVLWAIMRKHPIIGGRWDGLMMAEEKAMSEIPEWARRASVESRNPFMRLPSEAIHSEEYDA